MLPTPIELHVLAKPPALVPVVTPLGFFELGRNPFPEIALVCI